MLAHFNHPINSKDFVSKFKRKFQRWGNHITKELEQTWEQNCFVFNEVIHKKDDALKYVVSAPTGSAKTENMITYCAMLPTDCTVLISTNLIDEANRIAEAINTEASDDRACPFHSKNRIRLDQAMNFQIMVVTHAFYKNNNISRIKWKRAAKYRDLVIIDEAINTIREASVTLNDVRIAVNLFEGLHDEILKKEDLYQLESLFNPESKTYIQNNVIKFEIELRNLIDEFNNLEDIFQSPEQGTKIVHEDTLIDMSDEKDTSRMKPLAFVMPKFSDFINILKRNRIKCNKILTGIDDESNDNLIKEKIIETLENLNFFLEKQTYITAVNGIHSLNRVKDYLPRQSIVCLDATADVNKIYELREKYHGDIVRVPRIENVRDYSSVELFTKPMATSKKKITKDVLEEVLKSIAFGNETLFVISKRNKDILEELLSGDSYKQHTTDIATWGSLTGLNKWQTFDSCVIVGLNHKPKQHSQNRNIISTDNAIAFSVAQQNTINQDIARSDLVAEIVQAMNRIRIRKVTSSDGKCDNATIYLSLPTTDYSEYLTSIQQHMTNINCQDWNLNVQSIELSAYDQVISYLNDHLDIGDKVKINSLRDVVPMKNETFRCAVGKTAKGKQEFDRKAKAQGYQILKELESDSRGRTKKNPTRYIRRLS